MCVCVCVYIYIYMYILDNEGQEFIFDYFSFELIDRQEA